MVKYTRIVFEIEIKDNETEVNGHQSKRKMEIKTRKKS